MKTNKLLKIRYLYKLVAGLSLVSLVWLQACVEDPEQKATFDDDQILLVDRIRPDTSLALAIQALEKTNLASTLNTYGPYTFFAPNNQAFKRYFIRRGVSGLNDIPVAELRTVMQYHILLTKKKASDFVQGTFPDSTVNGDYFQMDISGGLTNGTVINGQAKVYQTGIDAGNAVVHKIDYVLDPPVNTLADYLVKTPTLSVLRKGMELAGLMDTLKTIRSVNSRRPYTFGSPAKLRTQLTVFAETDDVFAAQGITAATFEAMAASNLNGLKALMRYHIMPGAPRVSQYVPNTDFRTLGLPDFSKTTQTSAGILTTVMLPTLNYNDVIYYDKNHAKKINRVANIKPNGQDIFVKNGFVQLVDNIIFEKVSATNLKPYDVVNNVAMFPRVPIVHEFESRWYAYGAPVNSNSPRVFGPERASIYRPNTYFAFMSGDSPGDSITTIIPGIQKGKYRIEIGYKNGGNRNEQVQAIIGGKNVGGQWNMRDGNTYEQRRLISSSFEFKNGGTKRLTLVTNQNGSNRYDFAPDVVVLFPVN